MEITKEELNDKIRAYFYECLFPTGWQCEPGTACPERSKSHPWNFLTEPDIVIFIENTKASFIAKTKASTKRSREDNPAAASTDTSTASTGASAASTDTFFQDHGPQEASKRKARVSYKS